MSLIFEHYDIPEKTGDTEGTFKALCKYCKSEYSASKKATSNLVTHLKVSTGIFALLAACFIAF